MENQLVSIETAKLAKSKNFGVFEGCWYNNDKLSWIEHPGDEGLSSYFEYKNDNDDNIISLPDNICLAPTQSLLQKWLRERHNIIVSIIPHFYGPEGKSVKYQYSIFVFTDPREFDNYEDCLEIGLQEGLSQIKT